ncbi:MAG: hypothetical protein VX405_06905 [Myxococcota bacterium]|nr:hypothetical protein [Myxococcota bacterium]
MSWALILDAGGQAGHGHLMRGFTIAEELQALGREFFFVNTGSVLAQSVLQRGYPLKPTNGLKEASVRIFDLSHLSDRKPWVQHLENAVTVSIDERGLLRDKVDFVVDPTAGEKVHRQLPQCSQTRYLLGPRYALLRQGFGTAPRSTASGLIRQIAVCFGGSDPSGLAQAVIPRLVADAKGKRIDWLVGGDVEPDADLEATLRNHGHQVHWNQDAQPILQQADLAVIGFGNLVMEAACLGLPAILINPSPAHRELADEFAQSFDVECYLNLGLPDDLTDGRLERALQRLESPNLRRTMSHSGQSVVDGKGVKRVIQAIDTFTGGDS